MTIEPGQKFPSVKIKRATASGGEELDPTTLFAGKTVMALAGAGSVMQRRSSRPGGSAMATGPLTRVTSAPSAASAEAMAWPCLPEEWLEM